ncbi:PVC-type heme-binding CxxCH protein [Urbifossiella limnaea]|uniref:Cytochrome c n=1 Tax=Urbifossiella limnaea TaxID=2528023 RepID=A0A517XN79_9BACT|nr:PVC-type heme-binding CxxCH protein [Urbifossiella limnaea]QDU18963.1 Cytochrome c [Urbifossiella limnaea]
MRDRTATLLLAAVAAAVPSAPAAGPGGVPPAEAARRMAPADGLAVRVFAAEPDVRQPIFVRCDDRGRVWTIQYLQYPNPAGLKRVAVDRWSRTVYDRVPEPPPQGPRGADRITICEDTDGDGTADTFKDFVAGLNLCTGVEFGHHGVYVLQAPYLLHYPDRDRDDVPDADPEVLLSGFGMEDAQSLANHLTWGPDGWLYGLNGSTTTCRVRGVEFQQGVWRYHPGTREFELFCEGGGNVFGLTFDDAGNLFYSSNLGLFWHAFQGGYYLKNVGKHGPLHNPYAYGHLSHVAHDAPTGGPTTGGTVYRGDSFPPRFRGRFLAGDFLRHTASSWELKPSGATVTASFRELLLDSRDPWFGATDLCVGPDGAVYVGDFYDRRTAHPDPDADWDRSNGRVYRVQALGAKAAPKIDLGALRTEELVALLRHPNGWTADRARVLLAGRAGRESWAALRELARDKEPRLALRGLWALHATGGLDQKFAEELLANPSEHVRAWAVRLLGDRKAVSPRLAERFAELAKSDPSIVVRAQLLCTARRLPSGQALPVVEQALRRGADVGDPVLAWLLWWAVESQAMAAAGRVTAFFAEAENRDRPAVRANLGRLVRRYAADGTAAGYRAAHTLLAAEKVTLLPDLDRGLAERAVGRPAVGQGGLFDALAAPGRELPPRKYDPLASDLADVIRAAWAAAPGDAVRTRLALRAGVADARERVHADVSGPNTTRPARLARLAVLEELGDTACLPAVLPHLASRDADVQAAALSVVARVGGAEAGTAVVRAYPALPAALKPRARAVLFGRADWAKGFLALIDARTVAAADVPVEQVRLLALLGDAPIDAAVRKHWGRVSPGTPEEKLAEVRRFRNDLRAGPGDAARGKALFAQHCGACHKLFGEGGTVGPDLTTTSRADTAWLLASVVDPGAVVRAPYVPVAVRTDDGVVRTGIVAEQDGASLTLVDAKAERTRVPRERIESVRDLSASLMPEKLLDALTPQERRDLFRYLQQPGR